MKTNSLVDPETMDYEELTLFMNKIDEERTELIRQEKQMYKDIKGKLWLWWLFPIFGWVIYINLLEKRKSDPINANRLVELKKKIVEKEMQQLFNKRRIAQLDNK